LLLKAIGLAYDEYCTHKYLVLWASQRIIRKEKIKSTINIWKLQKFAIIYKSRQKASYVDYAIFQTAKGTDCKYEMARLRVYLLAYTRPVVLVFLFLITDFSLLAIY